MKKITVLYGNYGSGKTELALNIALQLRRMHTDVSLIDFDIVNPYFRSSEHKDMLERQGIRVIAPVYANTMVDLPAIPPDVFSAFKGGYAVFDCGGDPVGAAALGGLKQHFDGMREKTEALYVINTKRPFQDSAARILQSLELIQNNARLLADGFIFNANLGKETTGEELGEGYKIIKSLVQLTGVPLSYVSGTKESLNVFKRYCPEYNGCMIEINIFMRPEWM
ncbi:MAG: hypothetical protein ACOX8Q_00810 [Christensenellales bacterium]|jgi:hypothetical protein